MSLFIDYMRRLLDESSIDLKPFSPVTSDYDIYHTSYSPKTRGNAPKSNFILDISYKNRGILSCIHPVLGVVMAEYTKHPKQNGHAPR